jgi:hypothetical protein
VCDLPTCGRCRLDLHDTKFRGKIAAFGAGDEIDLAALAYDSGSTTKSYDSQTGVLTVSDIGHSVKLTLLGHYGTADFDLADDGHGGTLVTLHSGFP